ncbi:MAG: hypothetical protein GX335_08100 [Firmicutes bacterium]|nr:hypothetical protein [Bacillota bacterium]
MYIATIDCGTTNSQVYILNQDLEVVSKKKEKIGVKDTTIRGSNLILKQGLVKLFESALFEAGLKIGDIKFAVAFGMITSEIGLMEIPHLWAPAGLDELSESVIPIEDRSIFPLEIPLLFIAGIKNRYPSGPGYRQVRSADFMRGEETQMMGLLELYPTLSLPLTAVVLSSHTKYIGINQEKKIIGSSTTISGQIFEAIKERTFIGKSIQSPEGKKKEDFFETEVIEAAYHSVLNTGFLRTVMMPRFLEVLLQQPWFVRELFFDATIVAEDLLALNDFDLLGLSKKGPFVLIGHKRRCEVFAYLLKKFHGVSVIRQIHKEEEIDMLNIRGAAAIAAQAGYLD